MEIELWNWWITDPDRPGSKPRKSRWKMTEETAAGYPGATKVEGTREVRGGPDYRPSRHAQLAEPRTYYGPGGAPLPPDDVKAS